MRMARSAAVRILTTEMGREAMHLQGREGESSFEKACLQHAFLSTDRIFAFVVDTAL
jgi:hypothetical protein